MKRRTISIGLLVLASAGCADASLEVGAGDGGTALDAGPDAGAAQCACVPVDPINTAFICDCFSTQWGCQDDPQTISGCDLACRRRVIDPGTGCPRILLESPCLRCNVNPPDAGAPDAAASACTCIPEGELLGGASCIESVQWGCREAPQVKSIAVPIPSACWSTAPATQTTCAEPRIAMDCDQACAGG